MKKLLAVLLIALPLTVTYSATPVTATWNLPATENGGAALAASAIVKSTVKCGTQTGVYTYTKDAAGAATSLLLDGTATADGTHYCVVTATNADGESPPSGEVSFFLKAGQLLNPLAPAAPASLKVD